jgi:hypothetical protein
MSTPTRFNITISNPSPRNPTGTVETGFFIVEKGFVVLTDASGAQLSEGKHRIKLGPGEDATVLAKRMLRSKVDSAPRRHRGPIKYHEPGWM